MAITDWWFLTCSILVCLTTVDEEVTLSVLLGPSDVASRLCHMSRSCAHVWRRYRLDDRISNVFFSLGLCWGLQSSWPHFSLLLYRILTSDPGLYWLYWLYCHTDRTWTEGSLSVWNLMQSSIQFPSLLSLQNIFLAASSHGRAETCKVSQMLQVLSAIVSRKNGKLKTNVYRESNHDLPARSEAE